MRVSRITFALWLAVAAAAASPLAIRTPTALAAPGGGPPPPINCNRLAASLTPLDRDRLTPDAFRQRIDGQTLATRTGETYFVRAKLSATFVDEGAVDIEVVDGAGRRVASGFRDVHGGDLQGGSIYHERAQFQRFLSEDLDDQLGEIFEAKGAPRPKPVFDYEYAADSHTLTGIRIWNAAGAELGRFAIDGNRVAGFRGAGTPPSGDLVPFLQRHLDDAIRRWSSSASVRNNIRLIGHSPSDVGGQGLVRALYRKYAEAVAPGTRITIDANNRETLRVFRAALHRLVTETPGFASLPQPEKLRRYRATLLETLPETKWGRILKATGWRPIRVGGTPDANIFPIVCERTLIPAGE